jgi:hypothetical protein
MTPVFTIGAANSEVSYGSRSGFIHTSITTNSLEMGVRNEPPSPHTGGNNNEAISPVVRNEDGVGDKPAVYSTPQAPIFGQKFES